MSGLNLYTSNYLEILLEKLAEVLSKPLTSPLLREVIVVQSKGMERWISMELACHHGIFANGWFPYPIHFAYSLFRDLIPDIPEESPFDPAVMTWKVMGLLPSCLDNKAFESLRIYLEGGQSKLKRFQLAERTAYLFDQYLLFRPEMILDWEMGKEDHWQAILWRQLVKTEGKKHHAALQKAFLEARRDPSTRLASLPERISVFGISALPPFHIRILAAISKVIEVNLFLMNPCQEYWGDIVSPREMKRVTERAAKKKMTPEDLHLENGNNLLASMGLLGRDFFELITEFDPEEHQFFINPDKGSLLASIQSDILNLRDRNQGQDDKSRISERDDSIRIHSCHSPMREVEVLQDCLLALFETDPALLPKDILIMMPDIGTYAPFIQAVFSLPWRDSRWIPFSLADRGIRRESQLADAFLALLDLRNSRLGVSQVLAILEYKAVRNKFSLSEGDLELIHRWVGETRIRWGMDGESRKELYLPEFHENTWRSGLDRMLLGYALPRLDEEMFMGILPFDGIEGEETKVLGNFLGFMERIFSSINTLGEERTLEEWSTFLSQLLDEFFLADEGAEREVLVIRRAILSLATYKALSDFTEKVGLEVIESHLHTSFEQEGLGGGFLNGGLTFCAMLPMRSIPFRVICLLGMNDDAYPSQTKTLGFDLMAIKPRIGDRSRRHDDRYLFLEAILSAREKLHISYVGQSIQDNNPRPPSVLVSELLDYIEQGFEVQGKEILDHIVVRHRLQAFNPEYFKGSDRLYSYSEENFEAVCAMELRNKVPAFITRGLPEPGEEWKNVELQQLCRFFTNPARFLINQHLGIYLDDETGIMDENEPFDLTGLEKYQLEQGLTKIALRKGDLKDFFMSVRATGQLPHGTPGECCYQKACCSIEAFVQRLLPYTQGTILDPVEVDLSIGDFRLLGRIENIYADRLLHYRCAKIKPRDRLNLWIHNLVLNSVAVKDYPRSGVLICKDHACIYPEIPESENLLKILLETFWRGLLKPLHFFPESSWAYAESVVRGKDPDKAMAAARNKWEKREFDFGRGESQDLYFHLCFKNTDPLDEEFRNLAMVIFEPILRFEQRI